MQQNIEILIRPCIKLHIHDSEEVFIVKFNSHLLDFLWREMDIFYSSSLDKEFSHSLEFHCNIASHLKSSHSCTKFSSTPSSPNSHSSHKYYKYITFHKSSSHIIVDCCVLENSSTAKTLLVDTRESSY
jgi:hypothetical protein